MTDNELTNDEIIAKFDGWEFHPICMDKVYRKGKRVELNTTFKYSVSWDWLMPVVKKARPLWTKDNQELAATLMQACFDGNIDGVYKAVVEFIKWYNTQQK